METLEKAIQKELKKSKTGDKEAKSLLDIYRKVESSFNEGKLAINLNLDPDEISMLKPLCLITIKPIMFLANVDENGFKENKVLNELVNHANKIDVPVVIVCAKIESDITDLEEEEKKLFLSEMDLEEPGLNRVIRSAYKLLGLQTFFTAGIKEVRAWTVKQGAKAPQAAGVIHTDFEKGFIRAEVISYKDFVHFNGEQKSKEAGKMRLEGKDYIVEDGDVMHFRFNT